MSRALVVAMRRDYEYLVRVMRAAKAAVADADMYPFEPPGMEMDDLKAALNSRKDARIEVSKARQRSRRKRKEALDG